MTSLFERQNFGVVLTLVCTLLALVSSSTANAAGGVDRPMKLEIIRSMGQAPQIYWLGSSTSREIDPQFLTRVTGRRSFNAALSAGGPAEHYAMVSALRSRFADATPHLVIALDVESLRKRRFVPFSPRPVGAQPAATSRYRWDGFRRVDPYQKRVLAKELPISIARYQREIYPFYSSVDPVQLRYLQSVIRLANSWGDTPTIVVMPAHPTFARVLAKSGRNQRSLQVMSALAGLEQDGDKLSVVHLSSPSAFGGMNKCYSDGVHLRPCNAKRLITHVNQLGLLAPA